MESRKEDFRWHLLELQLSPLRGTKIFNLLPKRPPIYKNAGAGGPATCPTVQPMCMSLPGGLTTTPSSASSSSSSVPTFRRRKRNKSQQTDAINSICTAREVHLRELSVESCGRGLMQTSSKRRPGRSRNAAPSNDICRRCEAGTCDSCPLHKRWKYQNSPYYDDPSGLSKVKLPLWARVLPSSIVGAGLGVFATRSIPYGMRIGPYKGTVRRPSSLGKDEDMAYIWEVKKCGKVVAVIDGSCPEQSNYLRYINCACHEMQQNLIAYQFNGKIYYRTVQKIRAGEELLVWYGQEYGKNLGITDNSMSLGPLDISKTTCAASGLVKNGADTPPTCATHLKKRQTEKPQTVSRPTLETSSLPTPETRSLPTPETSSLPTPETSSPPRPETSSLPMPETSSPPTPETSSLPMPETSSPPTPEIISLVTYTPETSSLPTPETSSPPTPETSSPPTPEASSLPMPETSSPPTPEIISLVTYTPEIISLITPEKVTVCFTPEKGSVLSPEKGSVLFTPEKGSVLFTPEKGSVLFTPEKGSVLFTPEKGSVLSPGKATTLDSSSSSPFSESLNLIIESSRSPKIRNALGKDAASPILPGLSYCGRARQVAAVTPYRIRTKRKARPKQSEDRARQVFSVNASQASVQLTIVPHDRSAPIHAYTTDVLDGRISFMEAPRPDTSPVGRKPDAVHKTPAVKKAPKLRCPICLELFSSPGAIYQHLKKCHSSSYLCKRRPYHCRSCSERHSTVYSFWKHLCGHMRCGSERGGLRSVVSKQISNVPRSKPSHVKQVFREDVSPQRASPFVPSSSPSPPSRLPKQPFSLLEAVTVLRYTSVSPVGVET